MKKTRIIRIIIIVSVILIGGVLLSIFMRNMVNKAVYRERKEALAQYVEIAADSINDNISCQWEIAKVYENDVVAHCSQYSEVNQYLDYLNTQLSNTNDYYFLVDSSGKYYSSDGANGKLSDTDYFIASTSDKLEYIGTLPHFTSDSTYLILRTRLETPIKVYNNTTQIEVSYCCLMHDLTVLNEQIDSLFEGDNNTFVYDTDTGLMLYKYFGISLLLEGYNVFDKYEKINIEYGQKYEDIIKDIKNEKINVCSFSLKNNKYYICSSPLEVSNWSLLIILEGEYFNSISNIAFRNIILTMFGIILISSILVIALIWYFNKLSINKKILQNELKTNESLKEAYNVKSNFLSYMSHDIRTPINGMIGMSKIGLENSSDKEKVEDCFKKISLSSNHLLSIVNDVLDMSAIEAGSIVVSENKFNVSNTVSDCVNIIKGTLNNRNLTILENYNVNNNSVIGDEFHLKQVLLNVLSNAVKFTNDGGKIEVSCIEIEDNEIDSKYNFIISDTGIGMTEEFKNHIFEAFKTAKKDYETKYKGTGLGMAISNEYVNLMGGTIKVDSVLNEGSTFTITLSFKKVIEEKKKVNFKNLNILLVDDNDINLEITKSMLEKEVSSITICKNGLEALNTFKESPINKFNLILMDVLMPVMNGLDATKEIRNLDRSDNNVLIIALTANTYKDDIEKIKEAGINDYLSKPFDINQLINKIKEEI